MKNKVTRNQTILVLQQFIFFLLIIGFFGQPALAQNDNPPGKAVYQKACAACHDNPEATKSPSFDTLSQMSAQTLTTAITSGKMQTQASVLTAEEKQALIEFLAKKVSGDDWIAQMSCPDQRKAIDFSKAASVAGFGFDLKNRRHLSTAQTQLKTADLGQLELAWAMGFPGVTTMRSQPVVVGDTLFLPVAEYSKVFAINIAGEPCLQWVYHSDSQLRTSAAFGELPQSGRKVLAFGDGAATIHLIDATNGKLIWKQRVGLHQLSLTTGTPVIHGGRVYAPVSQYEIMLGANENYECCKTHGAVVALDGETGKKIWTAHTMENAKPVRDRGDGKMLWGPSGAPIWSSPAIDEKRGVLYVGSGEATSAPVADTTDAILAFDLKDGSLRWSFQATKRDIFLAGCGPRSKSLNCEKNTVYRDADFGASVIIGQRADGSDVVLAGQKAGTVWALDPDNNGALLWRQGFGDGSPLGGVHWGIAYDGTRVFAPVNRTSGSMRPGNNEFKPGLHAVNVDSGKVAWSFTALPDCSGDRKQRVRGCDNNIGLSGAPTVIDGALIEGSIDGFLRVFNAESGQLLFTYDTAQVFQTVNGVEAKGGAVDNASIVASNGLLFVSSGYGMFGQTPGNVLLAFRPKQ